MYSLSPVLGFQNDTLPSQHPAHSTSPDGCHASDLTSLLCPAITTRASSPALEYTLIDPSLDAAATLFESGDQQQQYRVLVLPLSVWVRLPLWPIHNLAELSLEAVHT